MIPELVGLVLGVAGMSGAGAWWWLRRAAREHVIRTRTAWVRAGTVIRFGPVKALCAGHKPQMVYTGGDMGALGITDRALVFDGARARALDRDIALDAVRVIVVCSVALGRGIARQRRALLVHHVDAEGQWQVSTFLLADPVALATELAHQCGLPLYDCGDTRADFGPAEAVRITANESGDWLPDRTGDLYLAPRMLVFNWTDTLPLDTIAHVDVFSGARAWLRVEFASGDVIGFEVAEPDAWADAIRAQSDTPVTRHSGLSG